MHADGYDCFCGQVHASSDHKKASAVGPFLFTSDRKRRHRSKPLPPEYPRPIEFVPVLADVTFPLCDEDGKLVDLGWIIGEDCRVKLVKKWGLADAARVEREWLILMVEPGGSEGKIVASEAQFEKAVQAVRDSKGHGPSFIVVRFQTPARVQRGSEKDIVSEIKVDHPKNNRQRKLIAGIDPTAWPKKKANRRITPLPALSLLPRHRPLPAQPRVAESEGLGMLGQDHGDRGVSAISALADWVVSAPASTEVPSLVPRHRPLPPQPES